MLFLKILVYLLNVVFDAFCMMCLLRVYMQYAKVSFVNPVGQIIIKLTNWLILPLQRVLPHIRRFDFPSTFAAYLCSFAHFLFLWLLLMPQTETGLIHSYSIGQSLLFLAWLALLNLVKLLIYLLTAIILVNAVLSWLQPAHTQHSFAGWLLHQLSAPLLAPVQKRIKPYQGLDFSPLVVLLILQVCLLVVVEFMGFVG